MGRGKMSMEIKMSWKKVHGKKVHAKIVHGKKNFHRKKSHTYKHTGAGRELSLQFLVVIVLSPQFSD